MTKIDRRGCSLQAVEDFCQAVSDASLALTVRSSDIISPEGLALPLPNGYTLVVTGEGMELAEAVERIVELAASYDHTNNVELASRILNLSLPDSKPGRPIKIRWWVQYYLHLVRGDAKQKSAARRWFCRNKMLLPANLLPDECLYHKPNPSERLLA